MRQPLLLATAALAALVPMLACGSTPKKDGSSPAAAPDATAGPTPTATPLPAVGQEIVLGEIKWKVLSAANAGQNVAGPLGNKTTEGKFVKVRVSVQYTGKEGIRMGGLKTINAAGQEYDSVEDIGLVPSNEACWMLTELKPGIPKNCTFIYEVAADTTGLKLQINDLSWSASEKAEVDLGL